MLYEPIFKDREAAGRALARHLSEFERRDDVVVLALPRGGVPVAFQVAEALDSPLDVFIVRKLGVPGQEELAFGALATGGVIVYNESVLRALQIPDELIERVQARENAELARREKLYRENRPPIEIADKTVIVIDDGLATGATMAAAVKALQKLGPREIVVGVPVASTQACDELNSLTSVRSVCVSTPEPFYGVGMWYENFSQTTDQEVQVLLTEAERRNSRSRAKAKGQ